MYQEETANYYTEDHSRKRSFSYDYGNYGNYGNIGVEAKKSNTSGAQPLLKLLVPNYAAGALLGPGGTLLNDLKSKYGCEIRLSPNREHYPGTGERIVVITGDIYQIIHINNHIMAKVLDPGRQLDVKSIMDGRRETVKIVLTDAAAALLIGISGNTIRAIQAESQANISLSMQDTPNVQGERVLTVSGTMDQRIAACREVITTIALDSSNMANTKIKYSNIISGYTGLISYTSSYTSSKVTNNRGQFSVMSGLQEQSNTDTQSHQDVHLYQSSGNSVNQASDPSIKVQCLLKTTVDIQMEVPNNLIGGMLGPRGTIIRDIALRSGAKLKFSIYVPSSPIRTLSITGEKDQTDRAFNLVNERVEQLGGVKPAGSESTQQLVENQSNTELTPELVVGDQLNKELIEKLAESQPIQQLPENQPGNQ